MANRSKVRNPFVVHARQKVAHVIPDKRAQREARRDFEAIRSVALDNRSWL